MESVINYIKHLNITLANNLECSAYKQTVGLKTFKDSYTIESAKKLANSEVKLKKWLSENPARAE
jgi:hypothetical protein